MTPDRFERRYKLLPRTGENEPAGSHASATTSRSRCCGRWTTPTGCSVLPSAGAFDLIRRDRGKSTTAYNTGRFGHGCLLARRLVEAGPLHRGHHRVRSLRPLGHARERPHDGCADEAGDRSADRPADSRPGSTRPARPHAGRHLPASSAAT